MCAALKVTRQGCCARRKRPPSAHDLRDAELAAKISEIYGASRGSYGAPKVFAELERAGERTSRKRVARPMRENGWAGTARGCARRPKGAAKPAAPQANAAPDLVKRDLSADGPNRAWFADITYVRTHRGWPCLAVVMDIWSRMIVGWSMSASMAADLADDALKMAIARRRPKRGVRPPQRPRISARVAAAGQDDARSRHQALDGVGLVPVGQRRYGVADGPHQVRARARPHVRDARAGGPRDLRVHRVLLQPGADPLGAGAPQPRGVRGEAYGGRRQNGGVRM